MQLHQSRGFTLIELIIVIVILGILAVTAAPKFIDLTGDAHGSTLQGVMGAINSGKTLAYSKCLIRADCDVKAEGSANPLTNSVEVQGVNITLAYGYPRHTAAGIARMINLSDTDDGGDFKLSNITSGGSVIGLRIRPDANYAVNQCEVRYFQSTAPNLSPIVEIDLDGC